jgi:hypothetical protein
MDGRFIARMALALAIFLATPAGLLAQLQQVQIQPAVEPAPPPVPPAGDDLSAESLRSYQQKLLAWYGGDYKNIPLEAKARFFQWQWQRYHFSVDDQVSLTVELPAEPGKPPVQQFSRDMSTWNGAALAGLSYQYAVTRDPETLAMIVRLVKGLHLFQQVAGKDGLAARYVMSISSSPSQPRGPTTNWSAGMRP